MSSKTSNTERLKRNAKKRSSDDVPSTSFAMNSIFNSENEFENEISTLENNNVLQNISFNISGEEQVNKNSVYAIIPTKGLFGDDRELLDFTKLIMQSLEEQYPNQPAILKSASDVNALKIKFNQIPLKKQHFTQFSYKSPIRLGVITNMYGAFVNSLDAFNERKKIFDLAQLEAKHRVSMLLPSVENWWHKQSKDLMTCFINTKFVNDLKSFSTKEEFTEAVNKFKLSDPVECWKNLKNKILTAKKQTKEGFAPGIFNVKVPNTMTMPSKIEVQLTHFSENRMEGKNITWKKLLLDATYIHAFAVISVSGFKITRSGISLDMEIEYLAYSPIPMHLQQQFIRSPCKPVNVITNKYIKSDAISSDDEEDNKNTECSNAKIFKYNFE